MDFLLYYRFLQLFKLSVSSSVYTLQLESPTELKTSLR